MNFNLLFGSLQSVKDTSYINLLGSSDNNEIINLKIKNIKYSICLAKLPGLSIEDFNEWIEQELCLNNNRGYKFITNNGKEYKVNLSEKLTLDNTNLYEGSYFTFRDKYPYVRISSYSKNYLNKIFKFTKINITKLSNKNKNFNLSNNGKSKIENIISNTFFTEDDFNNYLNEIKNINISIKNLSDIIKDETRYKEFIEWKYKKITGKNILIDKDDIKNMSNYISEILDINVKHIVFNKNTQQFYKIDCSKFMENYYKIYLEIDKSKLEGLDKIVYDALEDPLRFRNNNYTSIGTEYGINFSKTISISKATELRLYNSSDINNYIDIYGEFYKADKHYIVDINDIKNIEISNELDSLKNYRMLTYDLENYVDYGSNITNENIAKTIIKNNLESEFVKQNQGIKISQETNRFINNLADTLIIKDKKIDPVKIENEIICCSVVISDFIGNIYARKILFNASKTTKLVTKNKSENKLDNKYCNYDSELIDQLNYYLSIDNEEERYNYTYSKNSIMETKEKNKLIIIPCKDEKELLLMLSEQIGNKNIFLINGYNNWDYDEKYVISRSIIRNCFVDFMRNSSPMLNSFSCSGSKDANNYNTNYIYGWDIDKNFKGGSGTKKTEILRLSYPCKFSIDTMLYILKVDTNLDKQDSGVGISKSLNNMLKYWNIKSDNGSLAQKIDAPYTEISKAWDENNINALIHVMEYCIEDSVLTYKLLSASKIILSEIEIEKLVGNGLKNCFYRAIGDIIGSVVYKYYWDNKISYNDNVDSPFKANELFYTNVGGEVKCFSNGYNTYITAVDAESMYPAQKEANNIDTATKVNSIQLINAKSYGLELYNAIAIDDVYGPRIKMECKYNNEIFYIEDFSTCKQLKIKTKSSTDYYIYMTDKEIREEKDLIYKKQTIDYVKEIAEEINKTGCVPRRYLILSIDPNTNLVYKRLFFAQNPKDKETTRSIIYYSPKPQLLTEFRLKRKDVKKVLSDYKKLSNGLNIILKLRNNHKDKSPEEIIKEFITDEIIATSHLDKDKFIYWIKQNIKDIENKLSESELQVSFYDTKQATYKLIMNGEYGTSDSPLFSHYDPDCPSVVTWCSRQLIKYCRNSITSGELSIKDIYSNKIIPIVERYNNFVNTYIKKEYQEYLNIKYIYENNNIKFKYLKLLMVYQDTDSNYFKSELISEYEDKLLKDINEIEDKSSIEYNNLLNKPINILTTILGYFNDFFTACSEKNINNFPIKFNFEGAFYKAYYLGKKHYFGIKVNPICIDELPISREIKFGKFEPFQDINNYLKSINVKATGLSIIKRDTLEIAKVQIIKLMEYLLQNNSKENLENIVYKFIADLNDNFYKYDIELFVKKIKVSTSKNAAYHYNKLMEAISPINIVPFGDKLRSVYINPTYRYTYNNKGELNILPNINYQNLYINDVKMSVLIRRDIDVKLTLYLYKSFYLIHVYKKLLEMIMPELFTDVIEEGLISEDNNEDNDDNEEDNNEDIYDIDTIKLAKKREDLAIKNLRENNIIETITQNKFINIYKIN